MWRTLSGLFLVGALNRPRKRKRTNRENPRTIPEQIGKIPKKSGKSQKGQKKTKKEGQVQIGKPPRLKPPRLAALELWESAKVSHKRVFALLTPENPHLGMAQMLQKPMSALPGCQQMSVNTLLCDTLGLAEP